MADTIEIVQGTATVVEVAGPTGPQGPKGDKGDTGAAGQGVAAGGTTGQVLAKKSNTNYDTEWVAAAAGSGTVTSVALSSSDLTITGSPITASGTITANLANSGATAGTYTKVTVDAKGRVTSGATATAADVGAAANSDPTIDGTLTLTDGIISCPQYGLTINAEENFITFGQVPQINGATVLRDGDLSGKLLVANNGTNAGAFSGGAAGSVVLEGGDAVAAHPINGGGGAGGASGTINLSGGAADLQGGAGTAGGSIDLHGSDGGGGPGAGGSINLSQGGGSIDTSLGGGSINTRGSGSIQLGVIGTRTTLTGTATADRAISLPNASGTLALTSDIPTTFAASAITSGTLNTARLGSGTASSGSWLRGDSTWQALPAAGSTNLWIPASAWIPRTTNGCGVDSREQATNKINTDELLFDAAAIEYAQAAVVMPNNWNAGTITAKFYWTASSGSGDCVWQIAGRALANDDALDQAMGTAQTATDTLTAANDMDISPATSAVTLAGSPASGQLVIYEISRKATDNGDTLAVDARLLGVEISFN